MDFSQLEGTYPFEAQGKVLDIGAIPNSRRFVCLVDASGSIEKVPGSKQTDNAKLIVGEFFESNVEYN